MAESVDVLVRRIAVLEDVNAIQALKHRYLRACDRKQPEVVRDCFIAQGAHIDAAHMGVHEGRDSFVDLFQMVGCRDTILDMHHAQNPAIEITGADTARGTWDLYFNQINLDTRSATQVAGFYEDDYVRQADGWRIARSVFRVTSTLMTEVDEAGQARVILLGR